MKVIFHGDDFGLTSGINTGIIRSFKEGLLTSASIVASGAAAQEAISLARTHPELDTGVHLTLCDERPVLRPRDLSSIIPSGDRFPSRNRLLEAIVFRQIDLREAEAEWRAQIETVLSAGIRISHIDSHQFVHLFPGLLRVCLKIVRRYDIPFVRALIIDPPSLKAGLRRLVQWTGLAGWARFYASRPAAIVARVVPSLGFLSAGGRLTREALLTMLTRVQSKTAPPCTVEVMLHPGAGDPQTREVYRHWGYNWRSDLDLLTDPGLKKALAVAGIQATSFGKER